jgi:4-hydroxy-tetrahydrodipicolinate synthase
MASLATSTAGNLAGVYPVLATPFAADGSVSGADFDRIVDFNIAAGVAGLVFPGNASEVETLTVDERIQLGEQLAARVARRVPIVIGVSAATEDASRALCRHARGLQADAVMVALPSQLSDDHAAMRRLLLEIAEMASVPLILQNAPPPMGPGLSAASVAQLVLEVPQVEYVKEECLPTGQHISRLQERVLERPVGIFGGAAGRFIIDELRRGAIGCMPSCEMPELQVRLYAAFRDGDIRTARALYARILPLLVFTSVFRAVGVKGMLKLRGIIGTDHFRTKAPALDDMDRRELAAIADDLSDLIAFPPA